MRELPNLGATPLGDDRVQFCVWAPNCERVDVRLTSLDDRTVPLERDSRGYFTGTLDGVTAGTTYMYLLDRELERPDPASRFQPEGVHGPSAVVDPVSYDWQDESWRGIPLHDYVIYELHIGTFSTDGTFDGAIPYLDDLVDLGVTAVEILPVAQFPGNRNWGYDGVGLFAVQDSYGGPDGLRRFVDACHQRGLAVILDVVYNHLGPEGNYLRDFGPYFTDHYQTPWGEALNFDGPHSDHVRHFFFENARHWLREYRFDGFRFDAVHAIYDSSATHFLEELATIIRVEADRRGLPAVTIAESDLNDPKVIRSSDLGGWGHDSQWADDFHHALHALMTGERDGYYVDYGSVEHLAATLRQGYMFTGQYSHYRQRSHGRWHGMRDGRRFVVCSQNHDQVGNRATGDRLTTSLSFDQLKLVAGITLLSPFMPMLFQGEEYAEPNPFQYFVSHGDPDLVKAVQEGRKREFQAFNWQVEVPDPQAESTFEHSKLNHQLKQAPPHDAMFAWYRELLRLRRELPPLRSLELSRQTVTTVPGIPALVVRRSYGYDEVLILVNFGASAVEIPLAIERARWSCVLNSQAERWDGPDTPAPEFDYEHGMTTIQLEGRSFLVYQCVSEGTSS
jgi:maltooligosyltrehalose trehalohydrolase